MSQDYMKLGEEIIALAKKKGAHEVKVSISSGTKFSVDVRDGEVEQLVSAGSTGLSIKVAIDNKISTASSSDLRKETIERLLTNAIERTKYSNPDEFAALPELEKMTVTPESLKLYDPEVEKLSPEYKINTAKQLEKLCLADKRIKRSGGASFNNYVGDSYLFMSNGFAGTYRHSSVSYGVGLQAGSDDNLYEDGWWDSSINVKGLLAVEEVAKTAIHRTARMIGARKVKTQNVPVVIDPDMTSSMLLSFLASCLSGGSIYMKRSFLAGKLNEKIANENINIIDDGTIPGAPGTQPFDADGIPARRTSIIENGVLKNYMLDTYSARKLKMKTTGHASGVTNFMLMPGKHTPEEIIKSVDNGLYLVSTIGQGTVQTSGDISKGAYGIWIEKGELTYPVSEVTLSGNLGTILKNIEMIGNDPDKKSAISGPTLKIKEMTLSGS